MTLSGHSGSLAPIKKTILVLASTLLPFNSAPDRRAIGLLLLHHVQPQAPWRVEASQLSEWTPHALCLGQFDFSWICRLLCPLGCKRHDQGLENTVTNQTKYETHEHDVLIIGAGGAGLRAAIEGLAAGARVAVVSKSLLGKAHTVMAEGGIAA